VFGVLASSGPAAYATATSGAAKASSALPMPVLWSGLRVPTTAAGRTACGESALAT
jgi:hypothetical protein